MTQKNKNKKFYKNLQIPQHKKDENIKCLMTMKGYF